MDLVEIVERMKRFEKQKPQKVDSETEKYVLKYKPVRLEDYIEPDFYVRPPGTSIKNERIKGLPKPKSIGSGKIDFSIYRKDDVTRWKKYGGYDMIGDIIG